MRSFSLAASPPLVEVLTNMAPDGFAIGWAWSLNRVWVYALRRPTALRRRALPQADPFGRSVAQLSRDHVLGGRSPSVPARWTIDHGDASAACRPLPVGTRTPRRSVNIVQICPAGPV